MQSDDTLANKHLPLAGRLKFHKNEWEKLTSDNAILDVVMGYKIEFMVPPIETSVHQPRFTKVEEKALQTVLEDLLEKQVIKRSTHETGEFISPVFLRPKKNGKFRLILNLKKLNENIRPIHFKMDTIRSCINLMKKNCFMASLDLTDAYYAVSIHPSSQKYLKFLVGTQLYKYIALPNGLCSAPRIFTKLMKPVYSALRARGLISSGYLDHSFLVGMSYEQCKMNVNETSKLFRDLGFYISDEKSITKPRQIIEHLGFILNSIDMTVSLNSTKIATIKALCTDILNKNTFKIREAAQLIGTLVSCSVGVEFGPLFYKQLEIEKIAALKQSNGIFDAHMHFSPLAINDIQWWLGNPQKFIKKVYHNNPDFTLTTDASLAGWGAHRQDYGCAGGRWLENEKTKHINCLELEAAKLGLQSLCKDETNVHIHIQLDNVTAVAFINNMGGTRSVACNKVAREIWLWCIPKNIWLSATHIPGIQNEAADRLSRKFIDRTEWQLNPSVFNQLIKLWGRPEIDLFASRNNYQLKPFVSWRADPEALAIDAFCLSWKNKFVYLFPPFSMLSKVLQKLQEDQAEGILIAPLWKTQTWFPKMLHMLMEPPVLLPKNKSVLQLPHNRTVIHPLWPKLRLMACFLSGDDSKCKTFQRELAKLSYHHGEKEPQSNTEFIWISGQNMPHREITIPVHQL